MEKKAVSQRDILQELLNEGIGVDVHESDDTLSYKVYDKNLPKESRQYGHIPIEVDSNEYRDFKTLNPYSSDIPEKLQNKGIASRLYQDAEQRLGGKIMPDLVQTEPGFMLHDKHGFGKRFGLSDEELQSRLTPVEKLQRNTRKSAMGDAIDQLANKYEGINKLTYGIESSPRDEIMTMVDKIKSGQASPKNAPDLMSHAADMARKTSESGPEAASWLRANKSDFLKKVRSLGPMLSPVAGAAGLGALLTSQDASAAMLPGESLGYESGSLENKLESGERLTPEEYKQLEQKYRFGKLRSTLNGR